MMDRNKQRKPHRKGHGGSLSYLKIIINGVKKKLIKEILKTRYEPN